MKYPTLARGQRIAASVPALDGGLSCSFSAGDRQPSVCRDMLWEHGRLCTRRGWYTTMERYHRFALGEHSSFFTDVDGCLLVLDCNDTETTGDVTITAFYADGRDADRLFSVTGSRGLTGFLVSAGTSRPPYNTLLIVSDGRLYGMNASEGLFDELYDAAYVPQVRLNGTPHVHAADAVCNGDVGEPFNRLTERFRCTYTADGSGIYYALPTVYAESPLDVTWDDGAEVRRFHLESWDTHVEGTDEYGVTYERRTSTFYFTHKGNPYALPRAGLHNHIQATAQAVGEEGLSLSMMRFGTWFGGNGSAEGGGSRLFLGGVDGYVMWSAPNDPLYFPRTAYAQIGDADDPLTAFGKLGEWLVVFKRRSLYAMAYVRDSRVTAGVDLTTADVTATAVFPIIPLHADIGCDLPDTVAVHDNRLLFACRDGSVYALTMTANTRQVSVVSEPIAALLTPPSYAAAITAEGRYTLLWDETLYLLDRDGRWCEWTMPHTDARPIGLCKAREQWWIPTAVTVGHSRLLFWFTNVGQTDTVIRATGTSWADAELQLAERAVEGCVCTRLYDAGLPDTNKQLTAVFAEVQADDDVTVCYRTERGETAAQTAVVRDGIRLTPSVARCRQFALQLSGANLRLGAILFHLITR